MNLPLSIVPDHTAVRVALWRALHAEVDSVPLILEDKLGLQLVAPPEDWRNRPDMHPEGTRGYRASIVGRARFIEDLVIEQQQQGVGQYVILGAGLDTFAQRRAKVASKMMVFEIDKPDTQAWKQKRLKDLGLEVPVYLQFVPVDFEAGEGWLEKLTENGFRSNLPSFIASTGVAMYLTKEANLTSLRQIARFAPGSTLAMSFMLTLDLIDPIERAQLEMVSERARAAGTPFLSFFSPTEILALGREAGFKSVQHLSRAEMIERYFRNRSDGLVPASGEEFLVART